MCAYFKDLWFETCFDVLWGAGFHRRGRNIFFTRHGVTKASELCTEARCTQCGRPNIRAAATGAEIQGYTYDANFAISYFFHHFYSLTA